MVNAVQNHYSLWFKEDEIEEKQHPESDIQSKDTGLERDLKDALKRYVDKKIREDSDEDMISPIDKKINTGL